MSLEALSVVCPPTHTQWQNSAGRTIAARGPHQASHSRPSITQIAQMGRTHTSTSSTNTSSFTITFQNTPVWMLTHTTTPHHTTPEIHQHVEIKCTPLTSQRNYNHGHKWPCRLTHTLRTLHHRRVHHTLHHRTWPRIISHRDPQPCSPSTHRPTRTHTRYHHPLTGLAPPHAPQEPLWSLLQSHNSTHITTHTPLQGAKVHRAQLPKCR